VSRSDRSPDPEPATLSGDRAGGERHKLRASTTVRAANEEPPTLRLGTAPAGPLSPPQWRTRYDDISELARGGMSSIRETFDRVMRRRVAMKVHDQERDPNGLALFIEEARITAQLDHPNVIPIHDVQFDDSGWPSRFTMKLVEGETLADLLDRSYPHGLSGTALERVLGVFLKICDGVAFAHSRGVIHCDLKPSNILVGAYGQVYVTDWGVAMRVHSPRQEPSGDRATQPYGEGILSGTPAYMAPEQAFGRREEIDERTDIFGLGGILYAILTLVPPYDGGTTALDLELAKRAHVRPPQAVAVDRVLPPGLCAIAMRALSPDPGKRYPSVEALARDIESFLRGGGWFETVRYAKGALVVQEGDAPDAAYIVMDGTCELFRFVDGQRRFMRLLVPGEVFGETSIFGGSTRTASVGAHTDATLLRVTRDALERELERTAWLRSFVEAVAQRFIEVDRKLRQLEDQR
jgi:serine/threonine-protein kinase